MALQTLWFLAVALLWTGFFVLEGFDFGVGMLAHVVGRDEPERRAAMATVGPFWDANEVWLVVAAAALFAAFPVWYATMFSALYLALVLLLVSLILRGVAFEFRDRREDPRWRRLWDVVRGLASLFAPFLIGLSLANLLAGLPIDASQEFTGSFLDLFQPYAVAAGITLVLFCLLHGATFLTLKTDGDLRARAQRAGDMVAVPAAIAAVVYGSWTHHVAGRGAVPGVVTLGLMGLVIASAVLLRHRRDGWAFVITAFAMAAAVIMIFDDLYPRVMVSSSDPANSLTISNTAAGHYALAVMTIVAVILLPVVIGYQAWTYWVFHARVTGPGEGDSP
jgi:cytochrome bd-type quinol oxidase subunit 2